MIVCGSTYGDCREVLDLSGENEGGGVGVGMSHLIDKFVLVIISPLRMIPLNRGLRVFLCSISPFLRSEEPLKPLTDFKSAARFETACSVF